jgi:hypothetical protein
MFTAKLGRVLGGSYRAPAAACVMWKLIRVLTSNKEKFMKRVCISIVLLFSILIINSKSYGQDDFPLLTGEYLGQNSPRTVSGLES